MSRKHLPCLTNIVCKMFDQTRLSNNVKLVVQPLRREYCEISFPNDWHSRQFVKMFYYFSWLTGPSLSNSDMFEATAIIRPPQLKPIQNIMTRRRELASWGWRFCFLQTQPSFPNPLTNPIKPNIDTKYCWKPVQYIMGGDPGGGDGGYFLRGTAMALSPPPIFCHG